MKREFVKTENARRFRAAMAAKQDRGALESSLIEVHGRAGEGKTSTLYNWAASTNAVMLTAQVGWTPRRMMTELAEHLHISTKGNFEGVVAAQIAAEDIPIVVDEAGFALAENAACLERLRGITDKAGTLLVLAFMARDMGRLKQHDQITSRATSCPFYPSTQADVAAACAQLAEVTIEPDLVARIYKDTDARMRLVLEAIHLVEAVAKRAGKSRIGAAELRGIELCHDFNRALRRADSQRVAGAAAEGGAA